MLPGGLGRGSIDLNFNWSKKNFNFYITHVSFQFEGTVLLPQEREL